jgi:hypothetical protein
MIITKQLWSLLISSKYALFRGSFTGTSYAQRESEDITYMNTEHTTYYEKGRAKGFGQLKTSAHQRRRRVRSWYTLVEEIKTWDTLGTVQKQMI